MQNSFAFGNNNQNQMMTNNNSQANQTTSNNLSGNNNGLNNNFNNNANNNPYAKLKQWLGQSEQNINSALYPKVQGDDANSYQLAQNNKTNTMTDANNNVDYSLYGNGFSKEFIDKMTNDKEYQRALKEYAIPNEGGYVNDPQDPGGETKFGIAKRYHPNEDILNLTRERANAFLYKEIWNWNGINTLPPEIKGFVFDHGIRTSPQNAIETIHRALGIDPVGDIIGKTTLGKLKETDYNEFLRKYKELVREQDKKRSGYGKFGKGWDNRTEGYHISY